jgi:hypothetical protein
MMDHQKIVIVIIMGFGVGTAVYADMMPAPSVNTSRGKSLPAVVSEYSRDTCHSSSLTCLGTDELDLLPITAVSESKADAGQIYCTQPPEILADRQSSFALCLYALVGLGLCRSAPWAKKVSFCQIQDWYHHAGPYQIGHSHAIGPECLCSTTVCFIQPDCTTEDFLPQDYWGTLASLLPKSLFTPNVLAPRGPPNMSERLVPVCSHSAVA